MSYKKAYEKVYHSVVKGHPLRYVQMKIKEFLDLVDEETEKIMKLYERICMENMDDLEYVEDGGLTEL